MKKIYLLLSFTAVLIACSSDDDSTQNTNSGTYIETEIYYRTITITESEDCANSQGTTYCVSTATYDQVFDDMSGNGPCYNVSFNDIDNVNRSGYLKSMNTTNENGCTRNNN